MLFDLNNPEEYSIDLDLFNLKNEDNMKYTKDYKNYDDNMKYTKDYKKFDDKSDKLDLENGFYLGNIYVDLYKGYKNYKPKKLNAYSEQQKMLLRIYELDFILNDLNLYLDLYPNDTKMYELFKKSAMELNMLKAKYDEKYQVLELCKDVNGKYTWVDNPWPWDGGIYV